MFKLNFKKTEKPETKLPASTGSSKKQEGSRKISTSAFLSMPKTLTVWITTNCGKFFKRWEYQTTLPASWEICMQVKKQQLESDMKERTGSKLKGVCQDCVLSPCLFNFYAKYIMQNARLHEAEARLKIVRRNINNHRWHHPYRRKWRGTEEPLDESKGEEWKSWLKIKRSKAKIMASSPITSWQIDGEIVETLRDFISLGSKITADGDHSHKIEKRLLLGRKVMINLDSILKSRDTTIKSKLWFFQ